MLTFAFYKAPGRLTDKIIRRASGSRYSHVEFVLNRDAFTMETVSASKRDGNRVRRALIAIHSGHWDFVEVNGVQSAAAIYALSRIGEPYNALGAALSITPVKAKLGQGTHCSAFMGDICNAAGFPVPDPWRLTPGELYQIFEGQEAMNRVNPVAQKGR